MRTLLIALAIAGCSRAPTAATPANKAPAPDYTATANDELGFLPVDADVVVGLDMAALRRSQLWSSFAPQIAAFMRQAQEELGGCGDDFMKKLERMTMAFKVTADNQLSGVVVMHGGDMPAALVCSAQSAQRTGKTATMDRGVLILTKQSKPELASASRAVTPSTLVVHLGKNASYDSVAAVVASGTPLRKSGSFMTLFERRERGAAVWGMANGNAPLFNDLAQMGMRPKAIDGTLTVTDRLTFAVRLGMPSPAEATRVVSEVDKIKGPASSMVERFDARADGANVTMDVVITEAQLRSLVGMLGGMMGP